MMAFTIKVRFPLLLLLGAVFLALVCASSGISCNEKCLQRCNRMNVASRRSECRSRCEGWPERCEEEEEEGEKEEAEEGRPRHKETGKRERARQEGEKEEEEEEEEERQHHHQLRRQSKREPQEEEEGRQHRRRPQHEREQEEEEKEGRQQRQEEERHKGGRRKQRESEEEEGGSSSSSESHGRRNLFFFSSNRFRTIFNNENGRIRLLQRFDKRSNSNLFQNLQNYRLLEYRAKPRTLLLPQHTDADFILVVLKGKAILTVVNPNDRNSFNLERGDAIKLAAGTLAYLANRDNDEDLRVVDLAIPVNRPGRIQSFFPASSQNQQSYFHGFSRDILEASLNTNIKEIEKILLEEQQDQRHQAQEANPIVKVSREHIEELSKHAKASSRKSASSKSEPFNLRSGDPIYSNKFGQFFEITPNQSPQLQDLDLSLSCVEIKEGALMLPHYNSRANVILVVNEGKGHIELVGLRNEGQQQDEDEEGEQQEEDERSRQVHRYRARLSPGDVFIIPSSHPVVVNASSNLSFLGFGINAENNQRNFLAGEEDNVISQIHTPVKELAFPGSAQEVDRLIKNQKQSHFANAQPQQKEKESQKRRGPLSSILGSFY